MPRMHYPGEPSLEAEVMELRKRLEALERQMVGQIVTGARSDDASGVGVRVRLGLRSDGNYGIEVYSSSGVVSRWP